MAAPGGDGEPELTAGGDVGAGPRRGLRGQHRLSEARGRPAHRMGGSNPAASWEQSFSAALFPDSWTPEKKSIAEWRGNFIKGRWEGGSPAAFSSSATVIFGPGGEAIFIYI